SSGAAPAASVRSALAPQCEQNFAPTNIIPKHEGHATVASRAPQCSHWVASVEAGAPHIGQLSVSACISRRAWRFGNQPSRFKVVACSPALPSRLHSAVEFVLHRFAQPPDDRRKANGELWD